GLSAFGGVDVAGGRGDVEGRGDGLLDWEMGELPQDGQGVREVGAGSEGMAVVVQPADAAGGAAGPSGPLVGSPVNDSEITAQPLKARPLKVLRVYWKSLPGRPTIKEINKAIGLNSASVVTDERANLKKAGYLSLLPGKKRGKYALTEKGRKLFEQPAAVAVGQVVPDGQISQRLPRYQEVLKAIGEFTEQKDRGPTIKEVIAKINETAADKVTDAMVRSAVTRMKNKKLLIDGVAGLLDLPDKGWMEFWSLVGGGAGEADSSAGGVVGGLVGGLVGGVVGGLVGEGGLVGAGQPADGPVGSSLADGRSGVAPAMEGVRLESGPSAIEEFDLFGGMEGVSGEGMGSVFVPDGSGAGVMAGLLGGEEVVGGGSVGVGADGAELTGVQHQVLQAIWPLHLPTYAEIAAGAGITGGGRDEVEPVLVELESMGLVSREEGVEGLKLTDDGWNLVWRLGNAVGEPAVLDGSAAIGGVFGGEAVRELEGFWGDGFSGGGVEGSGWAGGQFGMLPEVRGVELGGGLSAFGGVDVAGGREGVEGEGDGLLDWEEFLRGGQGVQEVGAGLEGMTVVLQPTDAAGGAAGPSGPPAGRLGPLEHKVLVAIGAMTPEEGPGPKTNAIVAKINETIAKKTDSAAVRAAAARLKGKGLLTGRVSGVHDLTNKGREKVKQLAATAARRFTPLPGELTGIAALGPQEREIFVVIKDLTLRMKRGPRAGEVLAEFNETSDEKTTDLLLQSTAARLNRKELLNRSRGVYGLSDKGWTMCGLPVGGGAGAGGVVQGVDGGGGAVVGEAGVFGGGEGMDVDGEGVGSG
ncbi:hypothetical protein ACWCQR_15315, partial [Streptomyces sp. NPDC002172]